MTDLPEPVIVVQDWSPEIMTEIVSVIRNSGKRDNPEPFWKPLILFTTAGGLVGGAMAYLDIGLPQGYAWAVIGAVLVLIAWVVVARQRMAGWLEGELNSPSRRGPVTLTLSSEGIRAVHALSDTFFSWPAVVALENGPLALHVLTTPTLSLPVHDSGLPAGIDRTEVRRRIDVWRAQ